MVIVVDVVIEASSVWGLFIHIQMYIYVLNCYVWFNVLEWNIWWSGKEFKYFKYKQLTKSKSKLVNVTFAMNACVWVFQCWILCSYVTPSPLGRQSWHQLHPHAFLHRLTEPDITCVHVSGQGEVGLACCYSLIVWRWVHCLRGHATIVFLCLYWWGMYSAGIGLKPVKSSSQGEGTG
jgi:hypothetical protein